ncbi:MAG: ABC transporter substrate-binding protein [Candidatus Thorarchaeota archaeon]
MSSGLAKRFVLLSIVLWMFASPVFVNSQTEYSFTLNGPHIEKIAFIVMNDGVIGLLDDEVDMGSEMVDPAYVDTLSQAENIEIESSLRNGYGVLVINCAKYPFNITAFRRAVAFALDKEAISDDVWDGMSQPQDSIIPAVNPWTVEGQLSYTYYESNIEVGNQLLDAANFLDIDDDGFREAPDGSDFQVRIECAHLSQIATEVGEITEDALLALALDANSRPTDFYEYLNRLYYHGDYDIVFFGLQFDLDFDCDWMASEFHSDNADVPFRNCANFRNATFDELSEDLINSITYEEVCEAAMELQKILVYECPWIICFENFYISAHRTDRFEGFISIQGTNWWTYYQARLNENLGGPFGGTLRVAQALGPDTFNFMLTGSGYSWEILSELYDPLIRLDPCGNDVNWLCESYAIRTHSDNPSIPDGYTRIIFDLVQNATWIDGTPLTAEDVAFTFNYYRDTTSNPFGWDLSDMTAVYAPTPYRVIFEYSTESYWHLHTVSYKPIIPKHVFENIGLAGWNLWNPHPPEDEMVTSGPFNVSEHIDGEFTELTRNDAYFRGFDDDVQRSTTSDDPPPNFIMVLSVGVFSAVIAVVIGGMVILRRQVLGA